jgi:intracellular sulfur oxidation DsrE/DsrF family protein
MSLSRKRFISTTALGISAAALVAKSTTVSAQERAPVHFHVLKPEEYDRAAMLQKLAVNNKHRQVFQAVSPLIIAPGIASVYLHMQNAMNAYQFSLGLGNLSTLAVLIGPSIIFALNDDMWRKYNIGKNVGADGLASTNVYYTASSNLDLNATPDDPNGIYQDWSAQAVLKRGGQFFVCHNAATGMAFMLGQKIGINDPAVALNDFTKNLLPGFQMVPAGVAAVQQAQENGWKAFPII